MAEVNTGIEVIGEDPARSFGEMIIKPLYERVGDDGIQLDEKEWSIDIHFLRGMGRTIIDLVKIEAADLYCLDDFSEETVQEINLELERIYALGEDYIEKTTSTDVVYLDSGTEPRFNKRFFNAGYYLDGGERILSLADSRESRHSKLDNLYNKKDYRVFHKDEYEILKRGLISAAVIEEGRFMQFEESLKQE